MHIIGAHIKKESGSLTKTIKAIQEQNGNALQLFVTNPRSASIPNMEAYQSMAEEVKAYCIENKFRLVIHSSYTINLAKEPKIGKKTLELQDCYWINVLLHQLIVSEMLGAAGVVVHVGKYTTQTVENSMRHMYNAVKYVIDQLRQLNITSKLILETPAGAGTELLKTPEEFLEFYNGFSTIDRKHLGICIDTAHVWSSGYDIKEYYDILAKHNASDIVIVHLNNSKKEMGSHADVHHHILDKSAKIPPTDLQKFLKSLRGNPMIILETPSNDLRKEIEWTYRSVQ